MKARLTMRAALALGLPHVALGLGRVRRWCRALPGQALREAGKGNVLTAALLVAFYMAAV